MKMFVAYIEVAVTQHFKGTKCHGTIHFKMADFMLNDVHLKKFVLILCLHRSEEANKAFSAAVQMHDVLVKAWAMWGDYLENIFVKERQLHLGVSAITCYLHACRHQNESKSRKYLAKVRLKELALTKDHPVAFKFR